MSLTSAVSVTAKGQPRVVVAHSREMSIRNRGKEPAHDVG